MVGTLFCKSFGLILAGFTSGMRNVLLIIRVPFLHSFFIFWYREAIMSGPR